MIKGDDTIAGNPSLITDGEYVWPGDLSYYVKNYDVGIDEDFLKKMESQNWKVTITSEFLNNKTIYIDGQKL